MELKRLGLGRHTDRVDAARLAKMAALGTVPTVWVPPRPMRQVRRLLKAREQLDSQRRALLNQARAAASRYGLPFPRRAAPAALLDRLERMLLPPGERLAAEIALEVAQVLKAQVEALTAEIARQVAEVPQVRLLLTITGVGLRSSSHHLGQAGRSRAVSGS